MVRGTHSHQAQMLSQNPSHRMTPEGHYQLTEIVTRNEISVLSFAPFTVGDTCLLVKRTMGQVAIRVLGPSKSQRLEAHHENDLVFLKHICNIQSFKAC